MGYKSADIIVFRGLHDVAERSNIIITVSFLTSDYYHYIAWIPHKKFIRKSCPVYNPADPRKDSPSAVNSL